MYTEIYEGNTLVNVIEIVELPEKEAQRLNEIEADYGTIQKAYDEYEEEMFKERMWYHYARQHGWE